MNTMTIHQHKIRTAPSVGKNTLFPVFLKPEQLHILIIGGGAVGLEKLNALLANSPEAKVTLVSKNIRDEIKALAEEAPYVTLIEKPFAAGDLEGIDIAIAATNDIEQNIVIYNEAKARSVLINVADTPRLCDFYLGSIVQKDSLKIAISTNGASPTLAKRLREVFTEVLPAEIEDILQNLSKIRQRMRGDFAQKVKQLNEITAVLASTSTDRKAE